MSKKSVFLKPALLPVMIICLLNVTCNKKDKPVFTSLPSSQTHIDFANNLEKKKLFSILYYLYYYNGGGVATGDINNDGLPDIYFTANSKGNNKLYLNKGNFEFEDITAKAGVAGTADWCTGATMADVNGDGLLDIYVSAVSGRYGLAGHNELFINNGNGTFTEKSKEYGLDFSGFTTQTVFFDYDNDGDLDCYVLNQSHHPHANIVDTSNRRTYDSLSGDRLYRNDLNTTGKFTDVSKQAGIYQSSLGYGLGIAVGDINNDGWQDIYIGNDFHENDYYYINNGNGTFTESGAQHFRHYSRFSMGNDVADYNNDGQLDVVTVDMLPPDEKTLKSYGSDENPDTYKIKLEIHGYQNQYSKNCLQRNNGNGSSFSETSLQSGVAATDWSWAPLFADFDNDGRKDLFISSGIVKRPVDLDYIRFVSDLDIKKGRQKTDKYDDIAIENMPDGSSHPFLFKNDGGLNFTDVSNAWGTGKLKGYFNGSSYADLDNDGNLDLVINCLNAPAVVLKNNTPPKKNITIALKGEGMNKFGIGAKVYLFQKDKMQYEQLMLTRGFQSSCEPRLHFGLDTLSLIDSLLIVWPDQKYQVIKNIVANKQLEIKQADASGVFNYSAYFPPKKEMFEDISTSLHTGWKHQENDFLDYNVQYLIPHQESSRGPKIAVGDVNKDGLDDFFVCGARGNPGALMIQTKEGKFIQSDTAVFNQASGSEEVDAVFFDANNDGYPDLYVVSGGNEYPNDNPNLADRLYLNDGKGHFAYAPGALPPILTNKSTVSVADIDKDGDLDLFVGGLADARRYGLPQSSFMLINDGKGNFKQADVSVINLEEIGMVTTSSFADVNGDGWPDLVVTGEWMPMKIYINHNGAFVPGDIPQSTGLWQTVYTADVNGDGFTDILAGNWGHNSKLYAGKNGPLKLYVKDFDKNGSIEQIMAYTIDGKEYPFLAKDELERPLPVLKKAYLHYSDVAGKTVQYIFYDLFKDYVELKAETLGSACFINDGKGNFKKMDLPDELQLAPVFSFAPSFPGNTNAWLAAGNFYGVIPYEGRYDALLPTSFSFDKKNSAWQTGSNIPLLDGEVRDVKWLNSARDGKIVVIARNNKELLFYKPVK
ncbi:MAG: VCBS repeat-containing protein [Bacteroidota bacterium]|nr:VCBS repeat-containing protein [Bacteroidota bacterium]